MVVERATVEHHLGEAGQAPRGGEDSRMRRHSAEAVGVLVMHLAVHDAASPRIALRGGDAGQERGVRPVETLVHTQRLEDFRTGEGVQIFPRYPLQNLSEEKNAEVRIDALRAGRVVEWKLANRRDVTPLRLSRGLAFVFLVQIRPP